MSLNKVILIGRLGQDPIIKTTTTGKKVASFSIATDDFGKDKDGNKKTSWHNISAWEKQAELIEQYVKKGDEICIEGSIGYEEYEKDGVKKIATKITASGITFVGNKAKSGESETPAPAATSKSAAKPAANSAAATPAPAMADTDGSGDDLPF